MSSISELFVSAQNHFRLGHLQEGAELCRQILSIEPTHREAAFHLASFHLSSGQPMVAKSLLQKSLEATPTCTASLKLLLRTLQTLGESDRILPVFHAAALRAPNVTHLYSFLLETLTEAGEQALARQFLEEALQNHPTTPGLHARLGHLRLQEGRAADALLHFRREAALSPNSAEVLFALGQALEANDLPDEALDVYATCVRFGDNSPLVLHCLGTLLFQKGAYGEAISTLRRALEKSPDSLHTLHNLGTALVKTNQFEEGARLLSKVTRHQPDWAGAWLHLATALRELGDIPGALSASEKALQLTPGKQAALLERAATLLRASDARAAFDCFEQAHALAPLNASLHSDLLYTSNYRDDLSPRERFELHRQFHLLHEASRPEPPPFPLSDPDPLRKIRVGYVSGDLCMHSVAFFLEPILRAHDRSRFELFAYSNRPRQDKLSDHLRSLFDHWHEVHALHDDAMEALIRHHRIDILFDLSGHTARNRLPVFARKPAPIQLTTIGCMQTTGLSSIDFRITDAFLDPAGQTEAFHSEKLLRLDSGAFCFWPPPNGPEVSPAPFSKGQGVTFASFNNSAKISARVLECWAQILTQAPNTRLLMVGEKRNRAAQALQSLGIAPERLIVLERRPLQAYLELHSEVDVLLDTFPYSGLTGTLFAAWMGVPCLSLEGEHSVARSASAINAQLGLEGWIAKTPEHYVEIALEVARTPESLLPDRISLRNRVRERFCDASRFTRELEGRLLGLWAEWCEANRDQHSFDTQLTQTRIIAKTLLATGLLNEATHELEHWHRRTPGEPEPLLLLASVSIQQAQPERAANDLQTAATLAHDDPAILASVAELFSSIGRHRESLEVSQILAKKDPNDLKTLLRLGDTFRALERFAEAETAYREALRIAPDNAGLRQGLGAFLFKVLDQPLEALEVLNPKDHPWPESYSAHFARGVAYINCGRFSKAVESLRTAVGLHPEKAEPRINLGAALKELFQNDEAIEVLRSALRLEPRNTTAINNLGVSLRQKGDFAAAEKVFRELIQIAPNWFMGYLNLGSNLVQMGKNTEAISLFEKALELNPSSQGAFSSLIFCLNYEETVTPEEIFQKYREFSERFETPYLRRATPHPNLRDPERKLRIGYVSADLREHSVHYFAEPLLRGYNRDQFEVFCYYNYAIEDPVSLRLRRSVDHWRPILGHSDSAVAERIRADQIDILIDFSGHTAGNRVLLFGHKPAPIQVTMIGCMQSSGLRSMDYRFSDQWMDPVGQTEHLHTETLIRMEAGAFCLEPIADAPPVNPLPALQNGHLTFGSFNNLAKIKPTVLAVWAKILHRIPDSRLIVVGRSPETIRDALANLGIAPERIEPVGVLLRKEYLALHQRTDLLLDAFPYTGLTIDSIAAWMGVPSITIEGHCAAGRAGSAIMRRLGLPEFVARDEAAYEEATVRLAKDWTFLGKVRASLRSRCKHHLANTEAYVREFEQHLRRIWTEWCAKAQ
ncbi:MAG: hypothetical protein RLZZ399_103 [Verrucomicrobiota bacterium]|jgi:predicted O-linked N-acetylglucosamine transferase (SPINDLY family)